MRHICLICIALIALSSCEKKPCYYCTTSKVSHEATPDYKDIIPGTSKNESKEDKYCGKSAEEIHQIISSGTHTDTTKTANGHLVEVNSIMCEQK